MIACETAVCVSKLGNSWTQACAGFPQCGTVVRRFALQGERGCVPVSKGTAALNHLRQRVWMSEKCYSYDTSSAGVETARKEL